MADGNSHLQALLILAVLGRVTLWFPPRAVQVCVPPNDGLHSVVPQAARA